MLELRGITYNYAGSSRAALRDVSLCVPEGEVLAVLGTNGSGKSTLGRICNGSLRAQGGFVLVDGIAPNQGHPDALARQVGMVRQDPRSQLVSSVVDDELAFGPLNLGLECGEIERRVRLSLDACGIGHLRGRATSTLSGGELQLLALAGVLAMEPRYVVLDEACAQLDASTRTAVHDVIRVLTRRGTGVLQITHLVEEVARADRVAVLRDGALAWEGASLDFFRDARVMRQAGVCGPEPNVLSILAQRDISPAQALHADNKDLVELFDDTNVQEEMLNALTVTQKPRGTLNNPAPLKEGLILDEVSFAYGEGKGAVDALSLSCAPGTVTLLAGRPGSGKSTVARLAAGLMGPDSGTVSLAGHAVGPAEVGMAFQQPENQLFCNTVLDDVCFGPLNLGRSHEDALASARRALGLMGLSQSLWDRSPLGLSGGERRRVALAGILAMQPSAYVFDEPTAGLDGISRDRFMRLVCELARGGASILVVSHDVGEWLPLADSACLLREGRIVWSGAASVLGEEASPFVPAGLEPPFLTRLRDALWQRGCLGVRGGRP